MRLADVLVRQGHELIVWAPEQWRAAVEDLGARFEPSSPRDPARPGPGPRRRVGLTHRTRGRASDPSAACATMSSSLIRDSQTPWALVAAQYLGIPRIVSHPMFPMFGSDARTAIRLRAARPGGARAVRAQLAVDRAPMGHRARRRPRPVPPERRADADVHDAGNPRRSGASARVALHRAAAAASRTGRAPGTARRSSTHASARPRTGEPSCSGSWPPR